MTAKWTWHNDKAVQELTRQIDEILREFPTPVPRRVKEKRFPRIDSVNNYTIQTSALQFLRESHRSLDNNLWLIGIS